MSIIFPIHSSIPIDQKKLPDVEESDPEDSDEEQPYMWARNTCLEFAALYISRSWTQFGYLPWIVAVNMEGEGEYAQEEAEAGKETEGSVGSNDEIEGGGNIVAVSQEAHGPDAPEEVEGGQVADQWEELERKKEKGRKIVTVRDRGHEINKQRPTVWINLSTIRPASGA